MITLPDDLARIVVHHHLPLRVLARTAKHAHREAAAVRVQTRWRRFCEAHPLVTDSDGSVLFRWPFAAYQRGTLRVGRDFALVFGYPSPSVAVVFLPNDRLRIRATSRTPCTRGPRRRRCRSAPSTEDGRETR